MDGPPNRKARPDVAASGAGNIPRQRAELTPSRERDQQLLGLDFIGELGDQLVVAGAAIAAAASAGNVGVIEVSLRLARALVVELIGEFKSLPPQEEGGEA